MPEILTESFCERCGTRYTFESAAPKRRPLGRVRTLSKGLRNFVLSDETSFAEAMADARIDEEREASAHQLDAFHKTFNFCMSCRQYTCGNCWNEPEGRCLSCAPHLGTEILPAAFPDLDPHAGIALPAAPEGSNGHLPAEEWPEIDLPSDRLGRLFGGEGVANGIDLERDEAPEPEPVEAVAELEALEPDTAAEPPAAAEPEAAEAAVEPIAAPEDDDRPPVDLLAERRLSRTPRIAPRSAARRTPPAPPTTPEERAAAAAAQTSALLAKFRPGQSLDAALEAYEAELAKARGELDVPRTDDQAPEAASPPERVTQADAPPRAPEDAAPAAASAPPAASPPTRDDIELPAWPTAPAVPSLADRPVPQPRPAEPAAAPTVPVHPVQPAQPVEPVRPAPPPEPTPPPRPVSPPQPAPPSGSPPRPGPAAQPAPWSLTPPAEPEGEPQWPAAPQWPTAPQWPANGPATRADRVPSVPHLAGRPLVPDRSIEALWAASSSEVLARPAGPAAIQPCVNCGLSLSANARFCRRCGTRQS